MSRGKAKFKFSGEQTVMLCSHCSRVIKYWSVFSEEEKLAAKGELKLGHQYCDDCEEKLIYKN